MDIFNVNRQRSTYIVLMSAQYSIGRKTIMFNYCLIIEYLSVSNISVINNAAMNILVLMPLCAQLSGYFVNLPPKLCSPSSMCKLPCQSTKYQKLLLLPKCLLPLTSLLLSPLPFLCSPLILPLSLSSPFSPPPISIQQKLQEGEGTALPPVSFSLFLSLNAKPQVRHLGAGCLGREGNAKMKKTTVKTPISDASSCIFSLSPEGRSACPSGQVAQDFSHPT